VLSQKKVKIPVSAVKHAIPSLGRENILNLYGHYVHDEHQSPFSSKLYNRTKEELEEEQAEYLEKMKKVRAEWGAWDFKDERNVVRPIANFDKIPYKDLANRKFPKNSWQTDEKYVRDFIKEANSLVDRMTEGIYAEYGHPTKKADGTLLTAEEIEARNALFQVKIGPLERGENAVSFINQIGMDALTRKLLHAMITNDEFYFVLGGHSAAAGHGNNFPQQKTMQFHYIMEPVFHKLGMRLISRNLAMGGYGTLHFSMGQAELYGEKDFLQWDSSMTEKAGGPKDIFSKQALMNGERVPILFQSFTGNLNEETNGTAWLGDVIAGTNLELLPLTTGIEQAETLPLAARYQRCDLPVKQMCGDKGNKNKFDATCWVPRSDYEVEKVSANFPGQASWHPGNRYHQFESRKIALTILAGMKNALKVWEDGIDGDDGFPLKESYWHVGEEYKTVQNNLKSFINGEGKDTSLCEKFLAPINMTKACRTVMHGMTEFTPKNLGAANSIHAHLKASPNGYTPELLGEKAYSGVDILPLNWKIPSTEVDVHAIAIASTYSAPFFDHSLADNDDDDNEEEDVENSRRRLRSEDRFVAKTNDIEVVKGNDDSRQISSDEVVPGYGWVVDETNPITGYCDGSSNSYDCHRSNDNNEFCLLRGHNDGRSTLSGNALSGWLVIQIPKVKEGLIYMKPEWWHPRAAMNIDRTAGWTEVNNGEYRALGKATDWPSDVLIDIAINGVITQTWDYDKFYSMKIDPAYNEEFFILLDDEEFTQSEDGEPVELGIRIRSETDPNNAGISIAHIYYA